MRKTLFVALLLVSVSAFGQMHGGGMQPMQPSPAMFGPMHVTVSLDGTLILFTTAKTGEQKSELTALNATTGSKVWSLQLDAVAMNITPGANAFYVVLVKVNQETRTATRTLAAVNANGVVIWTQPLN